MIRHYIYSFKKGIRGFLFKIINKRYIQGSGKIFIDKQTRVIFNCGSKLFVNGTLRLNENKIISTPFCCVLRLDENSVLIVNGNTRIFYNCDIIVFKNARLEIGDSFINSDVKIRCHKHIKIGNGCAISHDVTIMDSNAHMIDGERCTDDVIINDNVWIGTRAMILSGVHIGEGAVIAAGSIVTSDVPAKVVVAGIPAHILKENVVWSI